MADARVGMIVGGSYRLLRVIGEGGMGSVYEAEHLRVPRKFAVKILKPEVASNQEMFDRFRREAEIASASGHEHVIEVIDFNVTDDGAPYMILEYLDGETLARRIHRLGRLSVEATMNLVDSVAGALDATHEKGVVHRDLKPQNIFLIKRGKRDDFVKVLDFGISKVLHDASMATKSGSLLGTPNYMAPEQLSGHATDIDRRTDVWALGAIAYECLTGTVAFNGPTVPGILYQVCHGQPKPLRQLVADLPDDLPRVITRALEKERDYRYFDAGTFRDDFLRACGRHVSARPPPPTDTKPGMPSLPPEAKIVVASSEPSAGDFSAPTVADQSGRFSAPAQVGTLNTSSREVTLPVRNRSRVLTVAVIAVLAVGAGVLWKVTRTPANAPPAPGVAAASSAPVVAASPSVTVASTPPVTPTTSAPAPAGTIEVKLILDPKDAVVEVDGEPMKPPLHLPRADKTYKLVVKAPGYVSRSREIHADSDKELDVRLDKETKAGQPPPSKTTVASTTTTATAPTPPPPPKPPESKIEIKGPLEKTL